MDGQEQLEGVFLRQIIAKREYISNNAIAGDFETRTRTSTTLTQCHKT